MLRIISFFILFIFIGVIIIQATLQIEPQEKNSEYNKIKTDPAEDIGKTEDNTKKQSNLIQKESSQLKILKYFNSIGKKYPWIDRSVRDAGFTREQVKQIAKVIENNEYIVKCIEIFNNILKF